MIGDSGGPLYLWDKDKGRKEKRATIIGVVSRGTGCANFNKPGIFTKIQHHLKWIKKIIATGDCKKENSYFRMEMVNFNSSSQKSSRLSLY